MKPLCIDGYCGLGGWAEGFLSEGWDVIGFDVERHVYGEHRYPAQLVLQDMRTLHGSQLKNADCLVMSPPCQTYSWMAMPWSKAKAVAAEYRSGVRSIEELNELFNTCFRLQREASEAAGRHIPMIVENVKGAQPWVGSAKWHYGSFYLWGDVPALMPFSRGTKMPAHVNESIRNGVSPARWTNPAEHYFGKKPDGIKNPGMDWSKHGQPGYKAQGFNVTNAQRFRESQSSIDTQGGVKFPISGHAWFRDGQGAVSSKSDSRKAASAQIAKIPLPLSKWIAKCFKPPT